MSIWATQFHVTFPSREEHGEVVDGDDPGVIYVDTSGWSTAIRLTVDEPSYRKAEVFISPDEARALAAALIAAADDTEAP